MPDLESPASFAARAWHFTTTTLLDGSPIPPVGEWLERTGPLVICKSGLHASTRLLDALQYAPGLTLHRVTLDGERVEQPDKLCVRRRRIDETREVPLRAVVRLAIEFACLAAWCAELYSPDLLAALAAADREDWAAARAAAWAAWAASDAAWAAASAAAWAASAAAWATSDAAWATSDAAWAASDAAWAASDAVRDAAGDASDAAGDASDAAWAALEARAVELLWGRDD